jgi:hypothetical protein
MPWNSPKAGCFALGEAERAYVTRTSEREAYKRAMETCQATKAWAAKAWAAKASAAEVAGR